VAKRKGAAAEGRLDTGPKIEDLLFEKACEKYLEWYETNRKAYTYKKYAIPASRALKASFDGKRLSQISPFLVEVHKLDRKRKPDTENPDRKPVTDTTVNHNLTFLRHMFNKCIEWKFALLAACNPDLRVLVLAAMYTGFRKSELKSLRWLNVDLTNKSVTVESRYAKNGDARTVPLHDDLCKALQRLKDDRKLKPEDLVFLYDGKPWITWRRSFRTALKNSGIKNFRFHDLRHCFGSWLAMNNVPDKSRMELMGHRDPKMTMRYTHLSPGYQRQAVQGLPGFDAAILEAESPQISPSEENQNVVGFRR
jgi:integrase